MKRPKLTSFIGFVAQSARPLARGIPGLLGVLLLLLQSAVPLSARAPDGADWVEICGEFGVTLIQLDLTGDSPASPLLPCKTCSDCVLCSAADFGNPATSIRITANHTLPIPAVFRLHQPDVAANAAQFWPDNRGPPRATPYIYQTATRAPMVHPHNSRRAP